MISKAKIKYIHSLELKKNRKKDGVFVAEGPKVVGDLLELASAEMVIATHEWLANNQQYLINTEVIEVDENELRKVSFLQHPQQVLAIFRQNGGNHITDPAKSLILALDGVQDPGNLGTIIRIADWFGIDTILCSEDTADIYNPKVVQATMGSIARVKVTYLNLKEYLNTLSTEIPIYGTFLDGDNIYQKDLTANGIIIMGSGINRTVL